MASEEETKKRTLENAATPSSKRVIVDNPDDFALKVLVSNQDAGAVIGKGGSVISEIMQSSAARVKMSQSGDFFPGTGDRVVLITGSTDAIFSALSQVASKLGNKEDPEADANFVLKLPVPNSAAGGIIGKGGASIRALAESSGAKVQLSQKDEIHPELSERVCSMTGSTEQVLAASKQVLQVMQEGDARYQNLSTNYGSAQQSSMGQPQMSTMRTLPATYGVMPAGLGGQYGAQMGAQMGFPQQRQAFSMPQGTSDAGSTTLTMEVQDALVGAIVGKQGAHIQQMQLQAGAKITVSQRDGSGGPRTVTITGAAASVSTAQMLVSQKLSEASAQTY